MQIADQLPDPFIDVPHVWVGGSGEPVELAHYPVGAMVAHAASAITFLTCCADQLPPREVSAFFR